ncbi:hypothetical protein BURMUCGD2M_6336 [Burkholderia multivorans CGD2M]|uniref:Uncharacterized protein n=1 Tax=Burkholderia multivorans CGD2 TaxID=513052 RepID=B9BNS7_9BURK|nr:hypothetical protein BURMUCGD2_6347 [Burkholderia multivorans CGD2]EEE13615.1 hypothetical protein BURMUCGD2M_6336 [Burkholderia multivorans CGD2M]
MSGGMSTSWIVPLILSVTIFWIPALQHQNGEMLARL